MLRVFGYTAWLPGTPVGDAIKKLRAQYYDRFSIRFSRPLPVDGLKEAITVRGDVLDDPRAFDHGAFHCPAETKANKFCGNCGACWESNRNVLFTMHGK
jgi:hypothetical protein